MYLLHLPLIFLIPVPGSMPGEVQEVNKHLLSRSVYHFCCLIRIISTASPLPVAGSGLNSTPTCTCGMPKLYSILEIFLQSGF